MRIYLLVFVIVLSLSVDTVFCYADDSCDGVDDMIIDFVKSIPPLSPSDLQLGKFIVVYGGEYSNVRYVLRGNNIFERKVPAGLNNFHPVSFGGYNSLFYFSNPCGYIIAPSLGDRNFKIIPSRKVIKAWMPWQDVLPAEQLKYQKEKDRRFSSVLYEPLLDGRPIEYLSKLYVKDIDSDGEMEVVTREQPDWVGKCRFSEAGRPYWESVYHISPQFHKIYDVSQRYPIFYSELAKHLQYSLEEQSKRENLDHQCSEELNKWLEKAQRLSRSDGDLLHQL